MLNKAGVVTGGASGIGRATADLLLEMGANIVVIDRDGATIEALVSRWGEDRVLATIGDISNPATAEAGISMCVDHFEKLDFLVNSAGTGGRLMPCEDTSVADFDMVCAANLRGTFACMKLAIQHMRKAGNGSIVNISSTAGIRAISHTTAYAASKWGVVGISQVAARENASHNVRINVVCPGATDTPLSRASGEIFEHAIAATPMGRVGQPSELAEAIVWLLSDRAGFITGAVLPVDGGLALA